jgi:hypothetical protein
MAYPAYTPDDLLSMNYETFLQRAALAEDRLMKAQLLEQPFTAYTPEQLEQPVDPNIVPVEDRRKIVQDYIENQTGHKVAPSKPEVRPPTPDEVKHYGINYQCPQPPPLPEVKRDKWWKISPVLEATNRKKIQFRSDNTAAAEGMSGWDRHDLPLIHAKMIEDAQVIYKDLIEEVARRQPKK